MLEAHLCGRCRTHIWLLILSRDAVDSEAWTSLSERAKKGIVGGFLNIPEHLTTMQKVASVGRDKYMCEPIFRFILVAIELRKEENTTAILAQVRALSRTRAQSVICRATARGAAARRPRTSRAPCRVVQKAAIDEYLEGQLADEPGPGFGTCLLYNYRHSRRTMFDYDAPIWRAFEETCKFIKSQMTELGYEARAARPAAPRPQQRRSLRRLPC